MEKVQAGIENGHDAANEHVFEHNGHDAEYYDEDKLYFRVTNDMNLTSYDIQ